METQQGFTAILAAIILVVVFTTVGLSMLDMVLFHLQISGLKLNSAQAYFLAEAGIEDALLRIRKLMNVGDSYTFNLAGEVVEVSISGQIGGSQTITAKGEKGGAVKRVEVVHSLTGDEVNFFFGAQVGNDGLLLENGSTIEGNVFSNGSITAGVGSGQTITGYAIVAKNGNKLDGVTVGEDARAHTCVDSTIGGDLYYVSGGSAGNCTVPLGNLIKELPNEIAPAPLPISLDQINEWKNDAEEVETYPGNYVLSGTDTASLGPLKIDGNLVLQNTAVLTLTGTLWVAGGLTMANKSIIRLDSNVYGFTSGVIVADGIVDLDNNISISGTGQEGSYLMILTTNPSNPAMEVRNSSDAGVFYASSGTISISNNAVLREVTGWGLTLGNNVTVQYEVGLADVLFQSGPGSGWQIENWREIE